MSEMQQILERRRPGEPYKIPRDLIYSILIPKINLELPSVALLRYFSKKKKSRSLSEVVTFSCIDNTQWSPKRLTTRY